MSALLLAAGLTLPAACDEAGPEDMPPAAADGDAGKADDAEAEQDGASVDDAETPALKMLAGVGNEDQLETLFIESEVTEGASIDRVIALLDEQDTDAVKIKGEGVPLFTSLSFFRLGSAMSSMARLFWSGKFFTFVRDENGNLQASLTNSIIGSQSVKAQVRIDTMAEAMAALGEEELGDEMPTFGLFSEPTFVDGEESVILDYSQTDVGIFDSIIDEIRPVSPDSLDAAGIEVPEGVDVSNLWIGRATARFGLFHRRREFALYFALDFDMDSVEVVDPE
jgi:hypothetical protein